MLLQSYRSGSVLFLSDAGVSPVFSVGMVAGPDTERVNLWDGWFLVPAGVSGVVPDTSWDGRGWDVEVKAGDRVRLASSGSASSLARVEVWPSESQALAVKHGAADVGPRVSEAGVCEWPADGLRVAFDRLSYHAGEGRQDPGSFSAWSGRPVPEWTEQLPMTECSAS